MSIYPISLARDSGARCLAIEWNDGMEQRIPFRVLRDRCPCAACRSPKDPAERGRSTGLTILTAAETRPLEIERMSPAGNYAYHIEFSDGHNTGIYSFELLRAIKPGELE